MSLGFSETHISPDSIRFLGDVCLNAFLSGQMLVAAAGNIKQDLLNPQTDDDTTFRCYPAAYQQRAFAVGAILPNGTRWRDHTIRPTYCEEEGFGSCRSSNFGVWLDVVAPGGRFIATIHDSGRYYGLDACNLSDFNSMGFNGTSAATPYVSGVAALLKSYQPELAGEDLEQILRLTTVKLPFQQPFDPGGLGHGLINARRALDFVSPLKTMAHWIIGESPFSVGPIAVQDSQLVQVDFKNHPSMPDTNDYSTSCMRYRLQGAVSWPFPFATTPNLWVRASGTPGWRDTTTYDHCFEVPWARVLPVGPQNAVYTTYVYRVRDKFDTTRTIGWFPTDPASARVALTVIGYPGSASVTEALRANAFSLRVSPNPVTTRVKFDLRLPVKARAKVNILDVSGRKVAVVADAEFPAGANGIEWNGRNSSGSRCPAGVYFCRVETGRLSTAQRFVLLGTRP